MKIQAIILQSGELQCLLDRLFPGNIFEVELPAPSYVITHFGIEYCSLGCPILMPIKPICQNQIIISQLANLQHVMMFKKRLIKVIHTCVWNFTTTSFFQMRMVPAFRFCIETLWYLMSYYYPKNESLANRLYHTLWDTPLQPILNKCIIIKIFAGGVSESAEMVVQTIDYTFS